MTMRLGLLQLLALLVCTASVHAIFEEQARRYTWHQQLVGRVRLAKMDAAKPRSHVFVATEKSVLAALSPKDGSVAWRKAFAEGDAITHLEVEGGRVFTLSGGGQSLRAFNADNGQMLWQAALGAAAGDGSQPASDLALLKGGNALQLVAAVGAVVKAYNTASGQVLWSRESPGAPDALSAQLLGGMEGGVVWAAALLPSQLWVALSQVAGAGDGASHQATLRAPVKLSAQQLLLTPQAVVALSEGGDQLCMAALTGAEELSCTPLAELLPAGADASSASLLGGGECATGQVVLQLSGGAAVLSVQGGAATLIKFAPGAVVSTCTATGKEGPAVALATPTAQGLSVEVVSAADGSTQQQVTSPALAVRRVDGGLVAADSVWLLPFRQGSKTVVRALVGLEDHTLAMLVVAGKQDSSAPSWVRAEALAGVVDVMLADLPAPSPENEAAWQAAQPGLGASIKAQLLGLKVQAMTPTKEELAQLAAYEQATNDKLRPTRDPDGFRKQVLVATQAGKVAAIHNGDGRILWSLDFGAAVAPQVLALWRVPHDVQHDIEVVAFHVGPEATTAYVINTHTGALLSTMTVPGAFADVVPLPAPSTEAPSATASSEAASSDGSDQHAYVLVPADPTAAGAVARLLPDTAPARAALAAAGPSFSFWRVDKGEGVIRGYGLGADGSPEERWADVLAPPGSKLAILEVAAHEAREAVQSHAKVLGDGSLKFKYLNPNTLLVAVGAPTAAAFKEAEEPAMRVLLLDAVTGRVLSAQQHEGAHGPVHAVLCEHWAVYHYWFAPDNRWQVSVVELYDASQHDLSVADLAFGDSSAVVSSWDTIPLEVMTQSFFTKLPVTQLSVTRTARGITARQILMSSPSGQVYMMDKRLVDPRRPHVAPGAKPTPQQQAEGLVPYSAELPLATTMFATGDVQVRGLRGVVTEPAALESSSLLFAHGLDLFYSRLSPSKTFDLLPDDFPMALLVIVVVGMAAANAALSVLNRRNALNKKWE